MPLPVPIDLAAQALTAAAPAVNLAPAAASIAPIALGGAAALGTKLLPALTDSTNPWIHKFVTNSPLIPFFDKLIRRNVYGSALPVPAAKNYMQLMNLGPSFAALGDVMSPNTYTSLFAKADLDSAGLHNSLKAGAPGTQEALDMLGDKLRYIDEVPLSSEDIEALRFADPEIVRNRMLEWNLFGGSDAENADVYDRYTNNGPRGIPELRLVRTDGVEVEEPLPFGHKNTALGRWYAQHGKRWPTTVDDVSF